MSGVVVPLGGAGARAKNSKPASIKPLMDLVQADMELVNRLILSKCGSDVELIPEVARHLIDSGRSRLPPMLTLASASMCGYTGSHHVTLAASVEFMHTATLLHDDVVDEATGGAENWPPACCGATRPAFWSATSCSARHSA